MGAFPPWGVLNLDEVGITLFGERMGPVAVTANAATSSAPSMLLLGHDACNPFGEWNYGCVTVLSSPLTQASYDLVEDDLVRLRGSVEWAQAGQSLGLGDVDGDGQPDVLIGAPADDYEDGQAYLVRGPLDASRTLDLADAVMTGSGFQTGFQTTVGDLDGDGLADLVIAHRDDGNLAGPVQVLYESVSGEIDLDEADSRIYGPLGGRILQSVTSGADLNGDGLDDLLIGTLESAQSGPLYVFHGPVTGEQETTDADTAIRSDGAYSFLGRSVSMTGDVDGDGCADLWVGAEGTDSERGAAHLFLGPIRGDLDVEEAHVTVTRQTTSSRLGASVALVDLNADGLSDLAVGADLLTDDMPVHGAVYLFYAPVGGHYDVELDGADAALHTPEEISEGGLRSAGGLIHTAGDINEDGFEDLFVGGHQDRAWIVLGGSL